MHHGFFVVPDPKKPPFWESLDFACRAAVEALEAVRVAHRDAPFPLKLDAAERVALVAALADFPKVTISVSPDAPDTHEIVEVVQDFTAASNAAPRVSKWVRRGGGPWLWRAVRCVFVS